MKTFDHDEDACESMNLYYNDYLNYGESEPCCICESHMIDHETQDYKIPCPVYAAYLERLDNRLREN